MLAVYLWAAIVQHKLLTAAVLLLIVERFLTWWGVLPAGGEPCSEVQDKEDETPSCLEPAKPLKYCVHEVPYCAPPPLTPVLLTPATVSEHCCSNDCWVILHGKVYDVTSWVPAHPGGAKPLLALGGRDATAPFEGYASHYDMDETQAVLRESYLGDLGTHSTRTAPLWW